MTDLGIVIVNWNTCDLLRRCLQTVLASQGVTFRVVVVDNASTDGSPDMVRAEFPGVDLIVSPINGGFAYANNLGLRALGFGRGCGEDAPCYALLLNPDTEVPPDALREMVAFMDADPRIGVAGPKLVLPDGSLDLACRRSFPTPEISAYRMIGLSRLFPRSRRFGRYNLTYLDPDLVTEVDSVVGAYMQVRREAIASVGLLDEVYFMYAEDIDWAYRVKQAGWTVWYNPRVTVLHVKRAASRRNPRAQREFYRAMLIFYRRHYRAGTPLWLHSLILLGLLLKGGRAIWTEIWNPTPLPAV
ncbi:MAG: glycosyltransferase family 2 protein [Anaerolineae bacterium]|nr:glycosyltransferase family 2 protein [Anaerolineae bacterium]